MINLAVITPGFFPNRAAVRMFAESCRVHGIDPIYYCEGHPYVLWAQMKIILKLPSLRDMLADGYSHVLYTDSRDAFFLASQDNIIAEYEALGSPPMLASAEVDCNPSSSLQDLYPTNVGRYRFHCVGGYIAELPWLIEKFERMVPYTANEGDDAAIWQWGYRDGWFRPEIDHGCRIFQTENKANLSLEPGGRILNTDTGTYPMILHLNGGYSSAVDGKYDRMLKWWDHAYPQIPLTREECSV